MQKKIGGGGVGLPKRRMDCIREGGIAVERDDCRRAGKIGEEREGFQ